MARHIDANAPTADVEEVKYGEWVQGIPYTCSSCGKPAPEEKNTSEKYSCWLSPYCPNCGALMDGTPKETHEKHTITHQKKKVGRSERI